MQHIQPIIINRALSPSPKPDPDAVAIADDGNNKIVALNSCPFFVHSLFPCASVLAVLYVNNELYCVCVALCVSILL